MFIIFFRQGIVIFITTHAPTNRSSVFFPGMCLTMYHMLYGAKKNKKSNEVKQPSLICKLVWLDG